jgi:hypothetical protein
VNQTVLFQMEPAPLNSPLDQACNPANKDCAHELWIKLNIVGEISKAHTLRISWPATVPIFRFIN